MSGSISASTLAYAALATSVVSAGVGAYGAIQQGEAAKSAADYQSQVERNNAVIAQQNKQWAAAAGESQGEQAQLAARSKVGSILAAQAASGLDVNAPGSAVDVRSSAAELGELNAINVRSNAARQAYGYDVQASSDLDQAKLDEFKGENDQTAGYINAGSTVLSNVGHGFSEYANLNSLDSEG